MKEDFWARAARVTAENTPRDFQSGAGPHPYFVPIYQRRLDILREAGVTSFGDLLRLVDDATSPAQARAAACELLSDLGERRVAPHLIGALQDPSPEVRGAAVLALIELGGPEAAEPLIVRLREDDDDGVRLAAVHALYAYAYRSKGYGAARAALLDGLAEPHGSDQVRTDIARAFGLSLSRRDSRSLLDAARPILVRALEDPVPAVRYWVALALGRGWHNTGDLPESREIILALERLAREDEAVLPHLGSIREKALAAVESIYGGAAV